MAEHQQTASLPGMERRRVTLRIAGYVAATAFCAVSLCANLRYGLSLGSSPTDKATYAVASVAADIFKMAAPLLVLGLWGKRFRAMAAMSIVLCLGCVAWSMCSAVGFALSSRGEAVADRKTEAATRHGWEAKVERAEAQLTTLGTHRPIGVIKAELVSSALAPQVWRRSRQCTELALEESRVACVPVLALRKELAAAEAAERLETQLVVGRAQLATVPVAGTSADPQAGALARLAGLDEATIRTCVALLLAGIIEAGSALGFAIVTVATGNNPPPMLPRNTPGARRTNPPPPAPTNAPGSNMVPCRYSKPPRTTTTDALKRWVQTRINIDPTAEIPAREACAEFRRWSHVEGLGPCTETRFGRDFTALIHQLGGRKVKRRDRAYYVGVSFAEPQAQAPAPVSLNAAGTISSSTSIRSAASRLVSAGRPL